MISTGSAELSAPPEPISVKARSTAPLSAAERRPSCHPRARATQTNQPATKPQHNARAAVVMKTRGHTHAHTHTFDKTY
jgi:hypothetical protein